MARSDSPLTVLLGFVAGVAAGVAGTMIATRRRRKPAVTHRLRGRIVERGGDAMRLYDPLTRSYVNVSDRRDAFQDVPASDEEIRAFTDHRRGLQPQSEMRPRDWPPPGGLGAGVSLHDSLLHFQDSTGVYFYLVAPPGIGAQQRAELLYMTSSNTAGLGCEALLSFFRGGQFNCVFRIWDWATPDRPGGGKFVKGVAYRELGDHLIPYRFNLDTGDVLDTFCVYVVNVTRCITVSAFRNEVYLHNHATGMRDLVWSYDFQWPGKDTTPPLWWGPIFETFPDPGAVYSLSNAVGFSETIIVQDGLQYQLTGANSSMTTPAGNGLTVVDRSADTNSALVCV